MQRPRLSLRAWLALVATTGALIGANLRIGADAAAFAATESAPAELDPVTRFFFYRGWPLSPCWFCPRRGLRFLPDPLVTTALILDVLIAGLILAGVWWLIDGPRPRWWLSPASRSRP